MPGTSGIPEVKDNNDLLWFGMVEKDRYWKKSDPEVRQEYANL